MYGKIIPFPGTTQAVLKKAVSFWLNRAEGPIAECGEVNVQSWAMANAQLSKWAETAPEPGGGYHKTDFTVSWEDGEEYSGSYDLRRQDTEYADLGAHIADFLRFHTGEHCPDHMTDEQYSAYMQQTGRQAETKAWLAKYEIIERFEPGYVEGILKREEEERKTEKQRQWEDKQRQKRQDADQAKERGAELLPTLKPEWAQAVIVAQLEVDDSDLQTDYFNTKRTRTVLLAWSKHTRDLFTEMRKAAVRFPETEHLSPGKGQFTPYVVLDADVRSNGSWYHKGQASHWHTELDGGVYNHREFSTKEEVEAFIAEQGEPEPITFESGTEPTPFVWEINEGEMEHREKYSMGSGYYLKAERTYGTGWTVRKYGLGYSEDMVCLALGKGEAVKEILEPQQKKGGKRKTTQVKDIRDMTDEELQQELVRLTAENKRLKGERC
jgi:hypothetical protein